LELNKITLFYSSWESLLTEIDWVGDCLIVKAERFSSIEVDSNLVSIGEDRRGCASRVETVVGENTSPFGKLKQSSVRIISK
jgi:hypothetical protein